MLVFVANYPDDINIRDGMMQRVAAIDNLVREMPRVYLHISFFRNKRKLVECDSQHTVYHLNFFLHILTVINILKKAELIYVHSIINLLKVHFFYSPNKTILDIHGVVPEEHLLVGKKFESILYNIVERKAILNCKLLIHVTKAMLKHYNRKYQVDISMRSIVLPIFDFTDDNFNGVQHLKFKGEHFRVVYAGGMQQWQNIELMVSLVRKNIQSNTASSFEFFFCFPPSAISSFKSLYPDIVSSKNVSVASFSKEEMREFLATCHLGFVLRDEILVNQVACPTKLIEYMQYGVVPIVLSKKIGDFLELGYQFIDSDELVSLHGNDSDTLANMALNNLSVLDGFRGSMNESLRNLTALLTRVK